MRESIMISKQSHPKSRNSTAQKDNYDYDDMMTTTMMISSTDLCLSTKKEKIWSWGKGKAKNFKNKMGAYLKRKILFQNPACDFII